MPECDTPLAAAAGATAGVPAAVADAEPAGANREDAEDVRPTEAADGATSRAAVSHQRGRPLRRVSASDMVVSLLTLRSFLPAHAPHAANAGQWVLLDRRRRLRVLRVAAPP